MKRFQRFNFCAKVNSSPRQVRQDDRFFMSALLHEVTWLDAVTQQLSFAASHTHHFYGVNIGMVRATLKNRGGEYRSTQIKHDARCGQHLGVFVHLALRRALGTRAVSEDPFPSTARACGVGVVDGGLMALSLLLS
jgi:hypothetical protein